MKTDRHSPHQAKIPLVIDRISPSENFRSHLALIIQSYELLLDKNQRDLLPGSTITIEERTSLREILSILCTEEIKYALAKLQNQEIDETADQTDLELIEAAEEFAEYQEWQENNGTQDIPEKFNLARITQYQQEYEDDTVLINFTLKEWLETIISKITAITEDMQEENSTASSITTENSETEEQKIYYDCLGRLYPQSLAGDSQPLIFPITYFPKYLLDPASRYIRPGQYFTPQDSLTIHNFISCYANRESNKEELNRHIDRIIANSLLNETLFCLYHYQNIGNLTDCSLTGYIDFLNHLKEQGLEFLPETALSKIRANLDILINNATIVGHAQGIMCSLVKLTAPTTTEPDDLPSEYSNADLLTVQFINFSNAAVKQTFKDATTPASRLGTPLPKEMRMQANWRGDNASVILEEGESFLDESETSLLVSRLDFATAVSNSRPDQEILPPTLLPILEEEKDIVRTEEANEDVDNEIDEINRGILSIDHLKMRIESKTYWDLAKNFFQYLKQEKQLNTTNFTKIIKLLLNQEILDFLDKNLSVKNGKFILRGEIPTNLQECLIHSDTSQEIDSKEYLKRRKDRLQKKIFEYEKKLSEQVRNSVKEIESSALTLRSSANSQKLKALVTYYLIDTFEQTRAPGSNHRLFHPAEPEITGLRNFATSKYLECSYPYKKADNEIVKNITKENFFRIAIYASLIEFIIGNKYLKSGFTSADHLAKANVKKPQIFEDRFEQARSKSAERLSRQSSMGSTKSVSSASASRPNSASNRLLSRESSIITRKDEVEAGGQRRAFSAKKSFSTDSTSTYSDADQDVESAIAKLANGDTKKTRRPTTPVGQRRSGLDTSQISAFTPTNRSYAHIQMSQPGLMLVEAHKKRAKNSIRAIKSEIAQHNLDQNAQERLERLISRWQLRINTKATLLDFIESDIKEVTQVLMQTVFMSGNKTTSNENKIWENLAYLFLDILIVNYYEMPFQNNIKAALELLKQHTSSLSTDPEIRIGQIGIQDLIQRGNLSPFLYTDNVSAIKAKIADGTYWTLIESFYFELQQIGSLQEDKIATIIALSRSPEMLAFLRYKSENADSVREAVLGTNVANFDKVINDIAAESYSYSEITKTNLAKVIKTYASLVNSRDATIHKPNFVRDNISKYERKILEIGITIQKELATRQITQLNETNVHNLVSLCITEAQEELGKYVISSKTRTNISLYEQYDPNLVHAARAGVQQYASVFLEVALLRFIDEKQTSKIAPILSSTHDPSWNSPFKGPFQPISRYQEKELSHQHQNGPHLESPKLNRRSSQLSSLSDMSFNGQEYRQSLSSRDTSQSYYQTETYQAENPLKAASPNRKAELPMSSSFYSAPYQQQPRYQTTQRSVYIEQNGKAERNPTSLKTEQYQYHIPQNTKPNTYNADRRSNSYAQDTKWPTKTLNRQPSYMDHTGSSFSGLTYAQKQQYLGRRDDQHSFSTQISRSGASTKQPSVWK